jgi:hypothetical protein
MATTLTAALYIGYLLGSSHCPPLQTGAVHHGPVTGAVTQPAADRARTSVKQAPVTAQAEVVNAATGSTLKETLKSMPRQAVKSTADIGIPAGGNPAAEAIAQRVAAKQEHSQVLRQVVPSAASALEAPGLQKLPAQHPEAKTGPKPNVDVRSQWNMPSARSGPAKSQSVFSILQEAQRARASSCRSNETFVVVRARKDGFASIMSTLSLCMTAVLAKHKVFVVDVNSGLGNYDPSGLLFHKLFQKETNCPEQAYASVEPTNSWNGGECRFPPSLYGDNVHFPLKADYGPTCCSHH